MLAVNYSTIQDKFKEYCDKVSDERETVIVNRGGEKNIVLLGLREYDKMLRAVHAAEKLEAMSDKAKKIAEELCDKLKAYDDFIGLYLYGSHVCGTPHAGSDIDILALFENDKRDDDDVIMPAWRLEIENDVIIDFRAYTPQQFEFDRLYCENVKKGLYYARQR
ncbi:MAG: type II toxin-antitoxin system prevent-host-death family antitoxin [Thermoguttaceae bacterium]